MNPVVDEKSKEAVELLGQYVNKYYRDYMELTKQIQSLQTKRDEMVKVMDDAIEGLAKATGLPKERWQKAMLDTHYPLVGMSIGDAIETLILSEGPKKQKELIDRMRAENVKISKRAPYAVIKNAILRDKRKRFKMLDDGRVGLVGVKEKTRSDVSRKRAKQQKPRTNTKGTGV